MLASHWTGSQQPHLPYCSGSSSSSSSSRAAVVVVIVAVIVVVLVVRIFFWKLSNKRQVDKLKAQSESLQAVQKCAVHITYNLTRGMPYSVLLHANLDLLAARREDLSRRFFRDIMDHASCLHSLLPPPRSTAITSRLRSSQILPKVYTRTMRDCSFIQYGLNHYQ